jgi:hypothetical protein
VRCGSENLPALTLKCEQLGLGACIIFTTDKPHGAWAARTLKLLVWQQGPLLLLLGLMLHHSGQDTPSPMLLLIQLGAQRLDAG